MLSGKKIAVLGVGTLGTALISGLLKSATVKPNQIIGTVRQKDTVKSIQEKLSVQISTDNVQAAKDADIVILAVKPQNMPSVLKTIAPVLNGNKLVILRRLQCLWLILKKYWLALCL